MYLVGCICQYMKCTSLAHFHMFCKDCRIVYKHLLSLNPIFRSSIQRYIWHTDHYRCNINNFLDIFHRRLPLSNIHICMKRSYLIFDKNKKYSLDRCKYIGNISFHWEQILGDIQYMSKFNCKKDSGNMLRRIEWVKFLQSIQCICLDLSSRKWRMMRNRQLNILICRLKGHNPQCICYKLRLSYSQHNWRNISSI